MTPEQWIKEADILEIAAKVDEVEAAIFLLESQLSSKQFFLGQLRAELTRRNLAVIMAANKKPERKDR